MKTTTFTLAAFAGLVAGQISDIPSCATQCGQDMVNNMGDIEIDNCAANDLECLCTDEKFILGVRDCANSQCGGQDVDAAVAAGVALCRSAGVQITTPPAASATDGEASGSMSGSMTASPSATSTGGNGGGAGGLVSTITSDGSTMVTTLSSTSGGIGDSISSGIGSLTSGFNSVTSALGSASSSLGSMASDIESSMTASESSDSTSTSEGGNGGGGDATGSDGSATSTDGDDAAPMRTAAPAGIIAAAGIAAFML